MNLSEKLIIVGITGGIAAYKAPQIVRNLKKLGAKVKVIMTEEAQSFITPLTMQAISNEPVSFDTLLHPMTTSGIDHIELAEKADAILIAPATANTIAKIRIGIADNLLTALILASKAPIFIAPSMNCNMWDNPATQENISILKERGMKIIGPGSGFQACGSIGYGRMSEPNEITEELSKILVKNDLSPKSLLNKKIVITAGPTEEPIDPVRFISNRSSGKMGYALAATAKEQGAEVILISGPVHIEPPKNIQIINVNTAIEMLHAVEENTIDCDIFISCAAVADFRVDKISEQKIKKKKTDDIINLKLIKNPDILATIAHSEHKPKIVIGFAAETQDIEKNALTKLKEKGADFIIANDVSSSDIGFNSDDNRIIIFNNKTHPIVLDKMSKKLISVEILKQCI